MTGQETPPTGNALPASAPTFDDRSCSVDDLKELVRTFVGERDWWRYHTPRHLAASISIEAAELLEHFQWTLDDHGPLDQEKRRQVADEMSDVLAYLLSLSHVLEIDLAASLASKMRKNAEKYPTSRFQGVWEKVHSPKGPR